MGWLAVALVIFTLWKPDFAIIGSVVFGALYISSSYLPTLLKIQMGLEMIALLKMIPYVFTVLVLIIISIRGKKENQPPAALGLPYFREER